MNFLDAVARKFSNLKYRIFAEKLSREREDASKNEQGNGRLASKDAESGLYNPVFVQ